MIEDLARNRLKMDRVYEKIAPFFQLIRRSLRYIHSTATVSEDEQLDDLTTEYRLNQNNQTSHSPSEDIEHHLGTEQLTERPEAASTKDSPVQTKEQEGQPNSTQHLMDLMKINREEIWEVIVNSYRQ